MMPVVVLRRHDDVLQKSEIKTHVRMNHNCLRRNDDDINRDHILRKSHDKNWDEAGRSRDEYIDEM